MQMSQQYIMENLNFTMISADELSAIKQELFAIKEAITQLKEKGVEDEYIRSTSIPKLLGVSLKTWQMYRDEDLIKYIQIGNKIWVKRADLNEFMDKNYGKRKNNIKSK